MKKSELYNNYLSKLEEALNADNFENIDYILESIYTIWIPEDDLDKMDDILQEATLYAELKEKEYKDWFIELLNNFKK